MKEVYKKDNRFCVWCGRFAPSFECVNCRYFAGRTEMDYDEENIEFEDQDKIKDWI